MITASLAVEDQQLWTELRTSLHNEMVQLDCEQPQVSDLVPFVDRLKRCQPDLVFLDVGSLREPIPGVLERLRSAAPDSMLVALNTKAEPATLLECFRGGANEYLMPPVADGIRHTLRHRMDDIRKNRRPSGKAIAFLSAKGGCGATTVACHVAAEIARLNQKVLLADFDTESGMVGFLMRIESEYSITDAFKNPERLDDSFWGALVSKREPGVDVIVAPTTLASFRDKRRPDAAQIRRVLDYARSSYQWTFVDLGRGLNPVTLASVEIADELCLIVEPQLPALRQARIVTQTLLDAGYSADRLHLVINRMVRRLDMMPTEMENLLSLPVYGILKERESDLQEAWSEGGLLPPGNELARQMARLARKLIGHPEEPKAVFSFFNRGLKL